QPDALSRRNVRAAVLEPPAEPQAVQCLAYGKRFDQPRAAGRGARLSAAGPTWRARRAAGALWRGPRSVDGGDRTPLAGRAVAPAPSRLHRRPAARPALRRADGRPELSARLPRAAQPVRAHVTGTTGPSATHLPELAPAARDRPHPGHLATRGRPDVDPARRVLRSPAAGRGDSRACRGLASRRCLIRLSGN